MLLLSAPQVATPSELHLNICPDDPPEGICLFPGVVGWVYTVLVSVELIVIIPAALAIETLLPAFISIVLAEEPSKVYRLVPSVAPVSNLIASELLTLVAVAALPPIDKLATGVVLATINGAVPVAIEELITPSVAMPSTNDNSCEEYPAGIAPATGVIKVHPIGLIN